MTEQEDVVSQPHVHIVQALYRGFGTGDADGVAEVLKLLSPDIEWSEPANPYNPAGGTRHGHAGFMEWLNVGRQSEQILALEPRQFLTGLDTVAVVGHSTCRVRATGRVYDTDFVHLVTFRGSTIVRFQEFFDTFAAAEAFRP